MPKFTAREDFRVGRETFEQGNSYTPEKHGIDEARLQRFFERGWIEVEGWGDPPERKPGAERIKPRKAGHKSKEG